MARRTVTSALMGDPRPGRTPWAPPDPSSAPTAASAAPRLSIPAPPSQAATPVLGSEEKGPAPFPPSERPSPADSATAPEAVNGDRRGQPDPPPLGTEENEAAPTLRPVQPICTKGVSSQWPPTGPPIFEDVDPATLLVEERYQRDLSDKSIRLIKQIVSEWDWRRFKPPVVAFADEGLQIIDGQHTAIAAASHPDIKTIPVMVVEAPELETRALAFIGHNRDRLQVTAMQLHHASVAAGDKLALRVEEVCARAGVKLVRAAGGGHHWRVGETQAINAVRKLVEAHGDVKGRLILAALVAAELAPIAAHEVRAAEMVFAGGDYADKVEPLDGLGGADLAAAIKALSDTSDKEARVFAAAQCVPYWRALGVVWFRKMKKRRKA
jgi:hypothetical protein